MASRVALDAKKYLRSLADFSGAKTYAEWNSEQKETGGNAASGAAAAQSVAADSRAAAFGKAGEGLRAAQLEGDGYALYLEKEKAAARRSALTDLENGRAQTQTAKRQGYRDYLLGVREANADQLEKAGQEIAAIPASQPEKAEAYAAGVATDDAQKKALMHYYRTAERASASATSLSGVLQYLLNHAYSYDRAYSYCRAIGLSDEDAVRLAKNCASAGQEKEEYLQRLYGRE